MKKSIRYNELRSLLMESIRLGSMESKYKNQVTKYSEMKNLVLSAAGGLYGGTLETSRMNGKYLEFNAMRSTRDNLKLIDSVRIYGKPGKRAISGWMIEVRVISDNKEEAKKTVKDIESKIPSDIKVSLDESWNGRYFIISFETEVPDFSVMAGGFTPMSSYESSRWMPSDAIAEVLKAFN